MIADIFLTHFKALVDDLAVSRKDGSWVIPIAQEPFREAAFIAANEMIIAINGYFIDQNRVKLQQLMINAVMDFNQRWDSWLEIMSFRSAESKVFHQMLLRLLKGMIKCWRIWLIGIANIR